MSFSIIVEDADRREIERCWRLGNENYLVQKSADDFPLLSNLNLASYDVFSSTQGLILSKELLLLKDQVADESDRSFLGRIGELAEMISDLEGWTITFTPFSRYQ